MEQQRACAKTTVFQVALAGRKFTCDGSFYTMCVRVFFVARHLVSSALRANSYLICAQHDRTL
jgi:hypothetical protein